MKSENVKLMSLLNKHVGHIERWGHQPQHKQLCFLVMGFLNIMENKSETEEIAFNYLEPVYSSVKSMAELMPQDSTVVYSFDKMRYVMENEFGHRRVSGIGKVEEWKNGVRVS